MVPPAPDPVCDIVVCVFYDLQRQRRYTGMGDPLPLSVADINEYLTAHPCGVPRYELDAAIFAADEVIMKTWNEPH